MNLNNVKSIYFIGINGISMQGLAKFFRSLGANVGGSDLLTTGHRAENIQQFSPRPNMVIISSAITKLSAGWVEVEAARRLGIPVKSRAWLIGQLMRQSHAYGIAIAGTHGKSTTTGMLGKILVDAGLDPLILGGAVMPEFGDAVRIPEKIFNFKTNPKPQTPNYIVAEACEYEKQFLKFSPKLAVITNIDKEHLDTYPKGLPEIIRVFRDFIKLVPANGISIVNGDDPNCRAVAKSARCPVKFFYGRRLWSGLRLIVIGDFNQMNATAAAKIAHELGINHQSIKRSLNQFQGLARRFEYKGQFNQADIFDDYAHHPSEIKATLAAVRSHFPNRKIMVIFQPHQFLRTKQLLDEFRPVFNDADQLFIGPIFEVPGRDDRSVISSKLFAESINHPSKTLVDGSYPEIAKVVQLAIRPHDVIITMGATPIYKVADLLIGLKLSANS